MRKPEEDRKLLADLKAALEANPEAAVCCTLLTNVPPDKFNIEHFSINVHNQIAVSIGGSMLESVRDNLTCDCPVCVEKHARLTLAIAALRGELSIVTATAHATGELDDAWGTAHKPGRC